MNDDKLLRERALRAEMERDEHQRFCARCLEQHRHDVTTLRDEMTALIRELIEARALLAEWVKLVEPDDVLEEQARAFLARGVPVPKSSPCK